jgi:hypothetical protein
MIEREAREGVAMSAPDLEPRDGLEALFLRLFRAMPPHRQRALFDALCRCRDGRRSRDAMVEMLMAEPDMTLAAACQEVAAVLAAIGEPTLKWRECLD